MVRDLVVQGVVSNEKSYSVLGCRSGGPHVPTCTSRSLFHRDRAPGGSSPAGSLDFSGGGGQFSYVNVPDFDMTVFGDVDRLDGEAYTMSLWLSPDNIPGESFFLGQTNQGIHQGLRDDGKLHQAHWGNDYSAATQVPFGEDPSDADNWVHATFTYDPEGPDSAIYYNGELDGEAFDKEPPNGDGNLIIGSRNGTGGPAFDGQIDDVAIWTSVLPEDDIAALAMGASPLSVSAAPMGYWNFDSVEEVEPGVLQVSDLSGNNYTGSYFEPVPPPPPIARLEGTIFVGNVLSDGAIIDLDRETLYEALEEGDWDAEEDGIEAMLLDDESPANCPFNENPTFINDLDEVPQFPNGGGDNFATLALGQFSINDGDATADETLTISVHVDSDDGGSFRVIGQSFQDVMNGTLEDFDGDDAIVNDANTCNTNFTGVIELTEGVIYDFETIHREAGGNAGVQVLMALGDQIEDPNANLWNLLQVQDDVGVVGDYNGNGLLDAGDLDLHASVGIANQDLAYDANSDGVVDVADRVVWTNDLKNTWMGDSDLNGVFDSSDFVLVFGEGKYETGDAATWGQGDWDGDMCSIPVTLSQPSVTVDTRWASEPVVRIPSRQSCPNPPAWCWP